MKLLTAEQMKELDRRAIEECAVPGLVLMENAGHGAAQIVNERYSLLRPGSVLVVTGKGNNGGDGYVMARHLENMGWNVQTLVLASRCDIAGDAATNLNILEHNHHVLHYALNDDDIAQFIDQLSGVALVIDAIFGNGLNSPVRGHYRYAIQRINAMSLPVVAVDIPSGCHGTTGEILAESILADCSISFAFPKLGQVSYPACQCGGELFVADIGMPHHLRQTVSDQYVFVTRHVATSLLPQRPLGGHKGTFGHVLVVAGSTGKGGAAQMSAAAGLRSGAGLVTLATTDTIQPFIAPAIAEVMTVALPSECGCLTCDSFDLIRSLWHGKTVVALGPGLGQTDTVKQLVRDIVLSVPCPVVIDADALNALEGNLSCLEYRQSKHVVVTPHPGEMARMTGLSIDEIQNQRAEVAGQFARKWDVVVVLKGARTVIAAPDGRVWINSSGNSGMGSGGMGDILTGVIAGWLAQGVDLFNSAVLGVYLHGKAADQCVEHYGSAGYVATDLLPQLPVVRQSLMEEE